MPFSRMKIIMVHLLCCIEQSQLGAVSRFSYIAVFLYRKPLILYYTFNLHHEKNLTHLGTYTYGVSNFIRMLGLTLVNPGAGG